MLSKKKKHIKNSCLDRLAVKFLLFLMGTDLILFSIHKLMVTAQHSLHACRFLRPVSRYCTWVNGILVSMLMLRLEQQKVRKYEKRICLLSSFMFLQVMYALFHQEGSCVAKCTKQQMLVQVQNKKSYIFIFYLTMGRLKANTCLPVHFTFFFRSAR